MATEVVMPQMGESIAEGTITKWLKNVGDKVERDSALVTIHFNDAAGAEEAAETVRAAYALGPEPVEPPRLIKDVLR